MFIFNELGLYLIYLIVFIITYFSYKKISSFKSIVSWNLPKAFSDLILGIVMGSFSLLIKVVNIEVQSGYIVPLFISTVLLIMLFDNYISALYSIIPPLIFWGLTNEITEDIYMIVSWLFILIFANQILEFTIGKKYNGWIISASSLVIGLMNMGISGLGIHNGLTQNIFSFASEVFIFFPLGYALIYWLSKFTLSSKILYEQASFVYSRFYRPGLATNAIGNFISKNKTNKALLGVFELNMVLPELEIRKQEVLRNALSHISSVFPEESVLFDATGGKYGFFIPIKNIRDIDIPLSIKGNDKPLREPHDFLKRIENKLNDTRVSLITTWNEKIDINIRTGVSIYGVQSNSIVKLIQYSDYALRTSSNKTNINLFDSKKVQNKRMENYLLTQMDEKLQLDNYEAQNIEVIDLNESSIYAHYADVKYISEYAFLETLDETIYALRWQNIFNRYFASQAVEKNVKNKTKIFFDYAPTIFEDNFNAREFVKEIQKKNASINNIVLVIKAIGLDNVIDKNKVIETIKELKNYGIEIALEISNKPNNEFISLADYGLINNSSSEVIKLLPNDLKTIFWDSENIYHDDELIQRGYKYKIDN